MQVLALFDDTGKVQALFHQSTKTDTPQLRFRPTKGQRVEVLEVPPEFEEMTPAQLHVAVYVI